MGNSGEYRPQGSSVQLTIGGDKIQQYSHEMRTIQEISSPGSSAGFFDKKSPKKTAGYVKLTCHAISNDSNKRTRS
ncbi:MAG: hypothetical protein PHW24_00135 [Candidatus Moranbacteria bacterium]|nr:hypothetical protein [Candidatus Moranbacteria bacterium]